MTGRSGVVRIATVVVVASACAGVALACASFSEKDDTAAGPEEASAPDVVDGGAMDAAKLGDATFCDGVKDAAACEDFDVEGGIGARGFTLASGSIITQDGEPVFSRPFSGRSVVPAFASGNRRSSVLQKTLGAANGYRVEARLQRKTNADTSDLTMVFMTATSDVDSAVVRVIARSGDTQIQFCRSGNCKEQLAQVKFDRWRSVVVVLDGLKGRASAFIENVEYYIDGLPITPLSMALEIGTIGAATSTNERVVWLDDVLLTQF